MAQPFCAVILSAGRSSRMGVAKAALRLSGVPVLRHLVQTARDAGAQQVRAVVSDAAKAGEARVNAAAAALLLGPALLADVALVAGRTDASPIDSLRRALGDWPAGTALLLWPVDAPFADAALVRRLAEALGARINHIAVPTVLGRRGHPVLFGAARVPELSSPAADEGARQVVRARPQNVLEVEATDPRLVARLDTPEAARAAGLEWPGEIR